jgi:hypothetical protein
VAASRQGAGSLRQEDISLRLQFRGVMMRLFPLDTQVISLLSPDSYRSMRELLAAHGQRIARAAASAGQEKPSVWYALFYALEPDARFSPSDVVITSSARDYRPLDIVPLSSGFGQQRIAQGTSQTALYIFDATLDVSQELEVRMEGASNAEWAAVLRVLERERARIRAVRVDTVIPAQRE